MPATPRLLLTLAAIAALAACDQARPAKVPAGAAGTSRCTRCHGDPARVADELHRAAPPAAVSGATAATDRGVGAHQAHLNGGAISLGLACHECHAEPGARHPSGAVVFAFSTPGNLAPATVWSPSLLTCATSYCHDPGRTGRVSPAWTAAGGAVCGSCHGLPPPPSTGHPEVSSALTGCAACHPVTMKPDGTLDVAGGKHVNGRLEAIGHGDYSSAAVHGPKALDFLGGVSGAQDCAACHGADLGGGFGPSCTACHATAGWTGWRTNCSFCHGARSAESKAGYDVATRPALSAPPDGVAQRLGAAADPARVGAHQAHLAGGAFSAGFACATCHAVPADTAHVRGSVARAGVVLSGAGQRSLPASLGTYDQASGTCATACHGAGGSPAWSSPTPVTCGGCHALPPPPATGHPVVAGGLTGCALCHPQTMKADGSLDLAGGAHLDGRVELSWHPDYSAPAVHGPKALDAMGGVAGALDCKACHGQDLGGGFGPSCNACHQSTGWTGWQQNCSFCHGVQSAAARAGYDLAAHPTWSAPPDGISQRITGTDVPVRTGAHQAHLTGVTTGGQAFALPFTCQTCHAVPSDAAGHVRGSAARAVVALSGAGQASLPAALGSYDQASGTCTTACHGAGAAPAWTGTVACGACHALPPAASTGHPTVAGTGVGGGRCSLCHPDTVNADGTIQVAGGKHVNGVVDGGGHDPGFDAPAVHGPRFFEFLRGATGALRCDACHGADYGGGPAPSCTACHAAAGWTGWQQNCSFCHGARTAAAKAGYSLASHPEWSAPPDALSQRLGGAADPSRTGAHQAHLLPGAFRTQPLQCATCHAVPATLAHAGGPGRAPVALAGAGQGSLPASLGSYDRTAGTCATLCHGSAMVSDAGAPIAPPSWIGGAMACASCHGTPPATGQHLFHVNDFPALWCADCHAASVTFPSGVGDPGTILPGHLNGVKDVVFFVPADTTWDGANCTSTCHGGDTYAWQ